MKSLASYLSFTGQAGCYAELPLDVLAGATTFTIEVKISTASTKSAGDAWKWGTIAGREIPFFGKDDFGLCVNDGKLCFWCSPASKGTSNSNTQAVTSSVTVNDGEIHKVAVVSSNGAIDLYCDGVNVAHADNVNAKITDAQTILLAYDSDSNSYLQMDLYEARFWNVARSAEEIFADITGTETGLQGWYLPTADGLKDYSGNDRHATLYGSPAYNELTELPVSFTASVERVIKNDAYIKRIAQSLKVWLPFDESATADKCGNSWTAYGTTSIDDTNAINGNALQLSGGSYVMCDSLTIGGQDFTIHGYCYMNSSSGKWARIFEMPQTDAKDTNILFLGKYEGSTNWTLTVNGTRANFAGTFDQLIHFEVDYQHDTATTKCFINGELKATLANQTIARVARKIRLGKSSWNADGMFVGSIDEFMILDGVALHTASFTPPTAAEYEELAFQLDSHVSFTVDVERRISNCVEFTADVERTVIAAWRYFNAGTADTLTVTGTTLIDLPEIKSVTGTAFYQTAREKCFDLPTTAEIWIKFDVYFDGSNRWRAYNDENSGTGVLNGISAQQISSGTGTLSFFASTNQSIYQGENVTKKNQLQTVLLHMVSGSSAGVVEAWVDGTKIHTYTGDVNHGEDFANIYLQSDGAGTFFSNVVISNKQVTFGDGYQKFTADIERRVKNIVEFTVPVERVLIEPIIIPFLMGSHFNHLIQNIYLSPDTPKKIVLPKTSKVYLHADGTNGGAVKIYSDTDDTGTVTGDVYAALDDCKTVYIKSVVSPQSILNRFMYRLRNKGAAGLDEAINDCTGGLFTSKADVINSFLNDLDNVSGFLKNCCGVILDNEDTGAAIGSDAGGGYPKNAEMVVPEPVPVENWVVPEKGSSKKIEGLTVNFPTTGHKGTFTDAEKHILAGLNSVWIEQALILIKKSCGLTFINWAYSGLFSIGSINVKFVDEQRSTLAYVAAKYRDGRAYELSLCVNMYIYEIIDKTSVDGAAHSHVHLDRTLAHELTHAVMAACIHNYSDLPLFIKEGSAELIHGIDDEDTNRIRYLIQTDLRSRLESIFTTGGDSDDRYVYVAGYLFFRYLIKQAIERGNVRPLSATVTNLFISDGEVDYYGHALTDNTRATLIADTLRELVKTSSLAADVEILDVIPVEFTADINRAIKGKVKLFTVDNSEYFSGSDNSGTLQPVVIPPQETIPAAPDNTDDLQSVEISLGEQQLTDNVSFVGVVPFDIMFPVQGQYLDYVFDMRVERVQQKGVLYTCDCCVDVDQLLYTQIAYTVPKSTEWHSAGESTATVQKLNSAAATAHAVCIANALGKKPVIQFDTFQSTVLIENVGGSTYADLIRDVFGWSSRVPTHMINVFIRDDKIYFVQRGHEARLIDLTGTKHTIPVVTHELVRMTWGSTPWSKSETREVEVYRPPTKSASGTGTGTGDDSGSGDNPDNPDDDDDENKNKGNGGVLTTSSWFDGYPESGYVEYYYDRFGRLTQSHSYVSNSETGKTTNTYIDQSYDGEGSLTGSETRVYTHGKEGKSSSRTTVEKGYAYLPTGEKFLSYESTVTYENGKLVSSKTIYHGASHFGQGTITVTDEGEFSGNVTGQNTGDDRVTPYRRVGAKKLAETALETALIAGGLSTPEEIYAAYQANHDANYYTEKQSRTLNGLSLYDSSFPIHNVDKLIELTEAISWLNRRTKETVTMTIYEYPHLIDFNDRILFNGAQYFLVSNVAMTNARVFNEQRVTFTRWY